MDLTKADWHKSSYSSNTGGNCVEVASNLPGVVAVRDSKDPNGPALTITPDAWRTLLRTVRCDQLTWQPSGCVDLVIQAADWVI